MNITELLDNEQHASPCKFGNIVDGHACYCCHVKGPRKCPIWRDFGEHDLSKWYKGGCQFFKANNEDSQT